MESPWQQLSYVEVFEWVISEGLEKYPVDFICYQWMKNHWHLVLSPRVDNAMSAFKQTLRPAGLVR
jgi:hypothetical protein